MGLISGLKDSISKVTNRLFASDDPKRIGIYGPPNAGKCLAADEPIQLADGTAQPIEEVFTRAVEETANPTDVSDRPTETWIPHDVDLAVPALGPQQTPTTAPVSHVFRQAYTGPMYAVETEAGRSVTVSPDHPFAVPGPTGVTYRPAKHLTAGTPVGTLINRRVSTDGGSQAATHTSAVPSLSRQFEWDRISTISEQSYDGYIYDLTVPSHRTFTTDDGLVVHNTTLANRIARDWTGDAVGPESHIPHETRRARQKENVEIERNGRTVHIDIVDTPGVTTKVDYEEFLDYDMDEEDAIRRSREATEGVAEAMHWLREDIEGVIYVLDATEDPLLQVNTMLVGIIESRDLPALILANKIDLEDADVARVEDAFPEHEVVELSALEGDNMDEVYDKIASYFG